MEHFLLDTGSIEKYIREKIEFFEPNERLEISEIGDGNINYVFKIKGIDSKRSLVIKQADKLLRSSGRPLDLHRNKIEAEILKIQYKLSDKMVPEIYFYDEDMAALFMEDISSYKNLRKELMDYKIFPKLGEDIAKFMVDTMLPTTDLVMDRAVKKENVKLFTNPDLCDISEDLVFTEPYYDYKNRNIIRKGNLEFVEKKLYQDEELHCEIAHLRNNFMNNSQALIHGDLHSGSIFINSDGLKVIDPEFAFYGPMGYDIGNVIGNLIFSLIYSKYTENREEFNEFLKGCIRDIFDNFKKYYHIKYKKIVKMPLYRVERFKEEYLDGIMADALGYAGTEIIRRTVGDSKVAEVTSEKIKDGIQMDRELIEIGIHLIKNRKNIKSGNDLIKMDGVN